MKQIITTIAIVFSFALNAQVKIGDNHATINANSLLELESTDKGLLMPRVALTSTSSASPLAAHVEGMTVYNTATTGDVTPGLYYNTGSSWDKLVTSSQSVPVGTIIIKGSNNVPSGYLYCNGQAISRTTYANLFTDIGTTYGAGDGSTTFNLPDYRGQFLRGQDDGAGIDPDAISRTGGDANGSTQTDADQLVTGSFGDNFSGSFVNSSALAAGAFQLQNYVGRYSQPIGGGGYSGANFDNSRVIRTSSETRPININVRYYIKF